MDEVVFVPVPADDPVVAIVERLDDDVREHGVDISVLEAEYDAWLCSGGFQ